MEARPLACIAMSVMGLVLVGMSGAQEPPPPEEPLVQPPPADPEADSAAGPTPGSPTLSIPAAVNVALQGNFGILAAGDSLQSVCLRDPGAPPSDFGALAAQ